MRSSAPTRCRRSPASSPRRRDVEMIWLSDGVDLGGGSEFVAALGAAHRAAADHRHRGRHCRLRTRSQRADNAAGALTVKVLRAAAGGAADRHGARARPQGTAARRGALRLQGRTSARPRPSSTCRSRSATTSRGSRSPASARPARCNCSTSAGGGARVGVVSGATADTAQPLLGLDLLPLARARPVRRRAARRTRLAGRRRSAQFLEQRLPMLILADVGNVARGARAAHALDRGRRRAGALRRPAARRRRRRSRAGEAAPRRPRARRQPDLGPAAAARRLRAREPVLRHAGADRRDREPAGAGRAGCRR